MAKGFGSIMKKISPIASKLSFGATKITDNILDKYAGTDIGGFKQAQAQAEAAEAARNQAALNAQLNANTLGTLGTENIVQVEAGGSAADASLGSGLKRKRSGTISSTLGI